MLHLILLLQISAPSAPVNMAVELLNPLKEYQERLIVAGDVRVVDGTEILSLQGSASERILGVPRLIEITKGTVVTLRLVQTYLPAAETDSSTSVRSSWDLPMCCGRVVVMLRQMSTTPVKLVGL